MQYPDDRRESRDRRVVDLGPPEGMEERRRGLDRRVMRIVEVEISAEEWDRYFSGTGTASAAATHAASILEPASS